VVYSAGTAYLTVVPSFLNIERAFRREAENLGKQFEETISKAIPEGMREAAKQASREGEKAGEAYAGAFATTVRKHMDKAAKGFQPIRIEADSSDVDRTIAQISQDLETLRTAKIGVELTEEEFFREAARIQTEVERLDREDVSIEIRTNARAVRAELEALDRIARQARGVDPAQFFQAVTDRAANERYLRTLREQEEQRVRAAAEAAERLGGALAEQIRRRLEAGLKAIGPLDLEMNTRDVDRGLADLARRMRELSSMTIDVDIPAAQYLAELRKLDQELERIEQDTVDVRIRSNARQARAEIKALFDFIEGKSNEQGKSDGDKYGGAFAEAARKTIEGALREFPEVELTADSTDIDRTLAGLRARLVALADVEIGVDMDASEVMATIAAIEAALRALITDKEIDIETRTNAIATIAQLSMLQATIDRLNGQNVRVDVDTMSLRELANEAGVSMSRLGLLVSVGAAIGPAIVPAAAAAAASITAIATAAAAGVIGIGVFALALSGIVKAVQALNKYEQDQAKVAKSLGQSQTQVANALDSVRSAERSLAATRDQVARGARDSARAVVAAQRSVIEAQRDAERAQRDLIRAMREAQQADEDRAFAIRDNALAQRQSNLDIADAKAELDRILANPRATEAEREQARITYEQRLLQLEQLGSTGKRLEEERQRVAKEGADNVIAAQERVRSATQAVADAQERHTRAIEAQTEQQRDGARQLVEAQENVARSQRALAQAYRSTGVAGGEALNNLRDAMAGLSPAGQRFALFIFSLKDEFLALRAAAERGLLPGLEQGIRNLLPLLPGLTKFVEEVGVALGEIFVDFTQQMQDPVWREFFGYLADTAVPALKGMFQFASNVAKGLAGIFLALTPFNGSIGGGLIELSEDFANWATTLDQNEGWQRFMDYVRDAAPKVVELFRQIWDFTKKIVVAAAPIGTFVVEAFTKIFEWLNKLDTKTWTIIIAALGGIALGLLAVSAATALITTGIAGLIVAAIAIIAAEWAYLYTQVEPVRKVIDATFRFIADAANWLYNNILLPVFRGIGWYIEHYVIPAFNLIVWVIRNVVTPLFQWWWGHVIKPIMQLVTLSFNVFKAAFQVAFGLFQIGLKIAGASFKLWWTLFLKPVWDLIKPVFSWLGTAFDKFVVPYWKKQIEALGKIWDGLVALLKAPIKIVVDLVLNKGLLAAYNKIAGFFNIKPDDVKVELPKGFWRGGRIDGPGTGTSDDVPIWASRGEHMWTAAEVAAVGGHDVMYGLRQAALNGTLLPGFRRGGGIGEGFGIGDAFNWAKKKASDAIGGITDFFTDPTGTLRALADNLIKLIPGSDTGIFKAVVGFPRRVLDMLLNKVKGLFRGGDDEGGSGGRGNTLGGSAGMMRLLQGPFPDLPLISGYRADSVTVTGKRSYHADDRAVDVRPQQEIAAWIRSHFMAGTRELISPWNDLNLLDGNPHRYSGAVWMTHNFAGGNPHVHWAYDEGGMLPPGWSMAWNGTGAPEPVLTQTQWRDMRSLATAGAGNSNTYNFEFADTTLTPGRLRAIQERDAVIAREGRAR
jgi:hypothetical protein